MSDFALTSAAPGPKRDLVFEAFCDACGIMPTDLTRSARGALNRAIAEVRAINSQLTPFEIGARARRFHQIFPNTTLTASALARHWAECWQPKREAPPAPVEPPAIPEPSCDWRTLIAGNEYLAGVPVNRSWAAMPRGYQEMICRAIKG